MGSIIFLNASLSRYVSEMCIFVCVWGDVNGPHVYDYDSVY